MPFKLTSFRPGTDDDIWVIPEVIERDMYRMGRLADWLGGAAGPVVDCGAHIGAFSCFFAHHDGAREIFAFEPIPDNFEHLTRNAASHGQVTAMRRAVDVGGAAALRLWDHGHTGRWSAIRDGAERYCDVETVDLSAFLDSFERVALLKLDLEGYEATILGGLPSEVLAKIGVLVIELHQVPVEFERLHRAGFETWFHPFDSDRHVVMRRVTKDV